jgi:hypothetical protein
MYGIALTNKYTGYEFTIPYFKYAYREDAARVAAQFEYENGWPARVFVIKKSYAPHA